MKITAKQFRKFVKWLGTQADRSSDEYTEGETYEYLIDLFSNKKMLLEILGEE